MQRENRMLAAYSSGHFWVDLTCAFLMFSRLAGEADWMICVLLYNFCAFAMQMPIGLLADRLDRNSMVASLGCALVAVSYGLTDLPAAAAVMAGLGNGCFHVGAGVDVLNTSAQRAAALGIFVSPGALGLYIGTLLGQRGGVHWGIPVGGLLMFGGLMLVLEKRGKGALRSGNSPVELQLPAGGLWVLGCSFLVVVLRSYIGMILSFSWKNGVWSSVLICAIVLGKAAGGFLGDRMGMLRASVWSLGGAAALFCLSEYPAAGVLAVFLFNMTMPITLWAAARLMPGAKGFAFGMLTFALFLGFLPVYLGWPVALTGGLGYALGAVCSLALLVLGLRRGGW